MSLNLGVMSAAVTLDDADYRKKLSGLETASGDTFKKIAQYAAGYLSLRAVSGFLSKAVKMFSDLEEETNKFNVVFQGMGKETSRVLSELRKDFGLSELAAKQMLAGTGDILTGFGFDRKTALELSEGAAKLGADIASFSNYAGGAEGATNALTKAMLGETESAKMLGVVIRQDDEHYKSLIKQAMTTGVTIDALGKTFVVNSEQQAKAVAALALAYEQSPNAIGDFVRSQDSIANQTRILQNNFQQLYSTIGGDLSGSYQGALQFSNQLLTSYNHLTPASRQLLHTTVALGGAFAVLAKTGMLESANKGLSAVGGMMSGRMFSGVKEQAEADLVAATENLKRAEYDKTDAFREAQASAQSVRIARLAVQEQEAAVATAKIQMQQAMKSGKSGDVLAAKKQLAAATQALTKAQLAESQATQQLAAKHTLARTANMQHVVAAKACAVANATNAAASTAAGRAQVVLAAGLTKARAAATAFATALGPIGAAMIALSGVYMAFQYISEKNRNILEGQVEAARRNTQAAKEMADAHAKERSEATANLERLQELSRYERLNNAEKSEAERLIEILTKKYGDLGISIDGVTGKLNLGADAWGRMNGAQRKEAMQDMVAQVRSLMNEATAMQNNLRNELSSFWKNSVAASMIAGVGNLFGSDDNTEGDFSYRAKNSDRQQELDRIAKLTSLQEQIRGLEAMRNSLTDEGNKEQAEQVDALIKKLQELKKKQDEFNAALEAGKKKNGENGNTAGGGQTDAEAAKKARQISESQRRGFEEVGALEWEIKFNSAGAEEQAEMLSGKMQEIFSRQSGKYATIEDFKNADRSTMTEQELKDLEEIIRLEEQRRQIREACARAFESELESYEKYLADRQKSAADKTVEKQIKDAQKSGDTEGANQIMRDQLAKAQKAARNMQRQYEQAVWDAQADEIMTEEERKRIADLRSKMQEAFSDQDKWQNRVDSIESNEQKQAESTKAIGSWSLAALEAMLGGTGKPEEQTAKNTKEMVRLQRDILEKTGSYS